MVIDERESRHDYIVDAARQIMTAGRTAPKGKGIDNIEIVALTQNSILEVAGALRVSAEETGLKFFLRDADNIELAEAVILVGSRTSPMGLNCGYCGYATCIAKGGKCRCSLCTEFGRFRYCTRIDGRDRRRAAYR